MGCPCSGATSDRQQARQAARTTTAREPREATPKTVIGPGYYWNGPARKADPAPADAE